MPPHNQTIDAVLPAGGQLAGEFARQAQTDVKALIRLQGQTLLARTIGVLQMTGRVRRIVVVGPEAAAREAGAQGADKTLLEGATGPENMRRGLEWLLAQPDPPARALIVTTDMPFLTPTSITDFLDACPPTADIALPILTRQIYEARFPDAPATYTRLADGEFTLGGAVWLDPALLLARQARFESLFAARKSPLRLAALIGPRIAARYLTRRLTVADLVAKCSELADCRAAVAPNAPAELAYDIDLPEEYAYALRHLPPPAAPPMGERETAR